MSADFILISEAFFCSAKYMKKSTFIINIFFYALMKVHKCLFIYHLLSYLLVTSKQGDKIYLYPEN